MLLISYWEISDTNKVHFLDLHFFFSSLHLHSGSGSFWLRGFLNLHALQLNFIQFSYHLLRGINQIYFAHQRGKKA